MPSSLPMPPPNPKQRRAFLAKSRYVAYGGARGGGKSWFVRWKAVLLCLRYPGIKVLITRKTFRELLNNHITPLLGLIGSLAAYNRSDKIFTFPNGRLHFLRLLRGGQRFGAVPGGGIRRVVRRRGRAVPGGVADPD